MWGKQTIAAVKEPALLFLTFFFGYLLLYQVCKAFGLVNTHESGLTHFFIPAGFRTVAALVGRTWGVVGISCAIALVISDLWVGQSATFYATYGFFAGFSTFIGIVACQRWLGIQRNLSNLRFVHLPLLDLAGTACHVLVLNAFAWWLHLLGQHDVLNHLMAQGVGNFLGGLIFMLFLTMMVSVNKKIP
jgi:hypothetical protein